MSIPKAFGMILQELRQEKGLSQEQLAQLAELDRTYISLLERGLRQPPISTLFKLCKNLNITPSQLMKMVEERNEN